MILAIDQGTTGTTCFVFDERAEPIGRAYREFTQHFPRPGWVEHDAGEIWAVTQAVAGEALDDAGVRPGELAAVGIANQRETVCVWDPATGEPLHSAIVWQDRRTAARCEELRAAGHEPLMRERTGLVLDPYFSATKIAWLLEHVPGLRERAHDGTAVFGTVDSWLIFKLTGEHLTDAIERVAHAALRHRRRALGPGAARPVRHSCPRAAPAAPQRGVLARPGPRRSTATPSRSRASPATSRPLSSARPASIRGWPRPPTGQARLCCLTRASSCPIRGRGCLRQWPRRSSAPTVASTGRRIPAYALEASIFVTGAAVQWLRDELRIIERAEDTETLAASLDSNDGVYFVPALTGLGSPHWDPHARGTIVGLTRGAGRAHLARATLEAIAYQTLDAVQRDAGRFRSAAR